MLASQTCIRSRNSRCRRIATPIFSRNVPGRSTLASSTEWTERFDIAVKGYLAGAAAAMPLHFEASCLWAGLTEEVGEPLGVVPRGGLRCRRAYLPESVVTASHCPIEGKAGTRTARSGDSQDCNPSGSDGLPIFRYARNCCGPLLREMQERNGSRLAGCLPPGSAYLDGHHDGHAGSAPPIPLLAPLPAHPGPRRHRAALPSHLG